MPLSWIKPYSKTESSDIPFGEGGTRSETCKRCPEYCREDYRLIILLAVGVILVVVVFFRHNTVSHAPKRCLGLSIKNGRLVLQETFHAIGQMDTSKDIPASLTPFFYYPVPINQAGQTLLETIPGIGPHLSAQIINTRSHYGPFRTPGDLLKVKGIGPKKMVKLAERFSYRLQ